MRQLRLASFGLLVLAISMTAAGQATVNVENATTFVGGTTTIDVTVSAVPAPGVTDIQGTITFDPTVMHITGMSGLNGFSGFFFHTVNNVAGTATFTAAIVGGPGVLAGEVLRISAQAVGVAGESCAVNASFSVFRDNLGHTIPVTVDPGMFTISTTSPPVADFTFVPTDPTIGTLVQFTDHSTDSDGVIVAWHWAFGDGGVSTSVNPSHQYLNAGTYAVTLTVTDDDGAQTSTSVNVTVVGPSAAFSYTPASPVSQELVRFFDQSATPTGHIASWSWAFGDGGVSGQQNPTHAYANLGTYRIDLTITTSGGVTVTTFRFITVRNAPPRAAFTFDPTQPKIGQMVTFGAGGSSDLDGSVVMFEWDFNNDGVTDATGATVTHSFDIVGARPVTLKVTDDRGAFDLVTHIVPIQASPPTAAFTFSPATPNTGQVVAFDGSGSNDTDGSVILYEWDFNNDGVTDATGMTATRSWPSAGVYPVTLTVTDNDGAIGAETHGVPVQVGGTGGGNQPPVADFEFAPQTGPDANIREVVQFHAAGSSDPDGTIAAYEWDFDNDGVYDATGADASHIYTTGGAKIVTLRVTDDDGAAGFKTRVVAVQFVRPIAAFDYLPTNPEAGNLVTFSASASTDSDGRVDFFEWDFDGNGIVDATGMTVTHIFATGGSKAVSLTVTDNDGVKDSVTRSIPVTLNAAPVSNFTFAPTAPTTADTVAFTSTSTDVDGTITAWSWAFGDAATSSVQTPSHKYAAAGTYQVTLAVTDNDGAIGQKIVAVVVRGVTNTAPVANFTVTPASPHAGEEASFQDTSTDAESNITTWAWSFGDPGSGTANTSALQSPKHTFAQAGTYTVTLTATDAASATSQKTSTVVVREVGSSEVQVYVYPNPAATTARVAYALPTGTTNPVLRIFTLDGREVVDVQLTVGQSPYLWNLLDAAGDRVGNGLYFCVVTATAAGGGSVRSEVFRLLIVR